MSLWVIRILFILLCSLGGYAISQVQPGLIESGRYGIVIGFGFAGLLIAVDEMLKGFSLRAFSAATFGLILGTVMAWLMDRSQLFVFAEDVVITGEGTPTRWIIRLSLFVGFSYIGMVLAMRSNKDDFSLIIPYVRFSAQKKPENLYLLDTSAIIDGRIAGMVDTNFLEGILVVPRFVLKELQIVADSTEPVRRARGRRGLETLSRLQRNHKNEVKIHEGDIPEEAGVDSKLVRLAHGLGAKLLTTDYNLGKIAELQSVAYLNINELANSVKPVILPGERLNLKLVREGKDKGQGVGYLNDGTMVVVNNGSSLIGQQVDVEVQSLLQTGAGVIIFADVNGSGRKNIPIT